jgi:hypothetical protein
MTTPAEHDLIIFLSNENDRLVLGCRACDFLINFRFESEVHPIPIGVRSLLDHFTPWCEQPEKALDLAWKMDKAVHRIV